MHDNTRWPPCLEMKVEAISHSIPEFVASVFAIVQVS